MIKEKYKEHLESYLSSLKADIDFLKKIKIPEFKTINIDCAKIKGFEGWEKRLEAKGVNEFSSVLYYLSFGNEINPLDILKKVTPLKKVKKTKQRSKYVALSKINAANADKCFGILYVGKTNSNFPSRMKHHLGLVNSHTYALQLKHWANDFKFTLNFAVVDIQTNDIRYLEQMESALHYGLHPLLGRSGH